MNGPGIPWYLAISAILFSTGIAGVLLRRSPLIVGMRGSSQPLTIPSRTNSKSRRLLITVYVRFSRANSICCGW